MKYQKLVNKLNSLLDSAVQQRHTRKEKLEFYLGQFKAKEQNLRQKLEKENNKTSRRKLKRELGAVKKAYAMLGS